MKVDARLYTRGDGPFSLAIAAIFLCLSVATQSHASGAAHPEADSAVATIMGLHTTNEPIVKTRADQMTDQMNDEVEALKARIREQTNARMGISTPAPAPTPPPTPEAVIDYQMLFEMMAAQDPADHIKQQIAQQIVTGPLGHELPVLQKWPEIPALRKSIPASAEFTNAFWQLPIDILRVNDYKLNNHTCYLMNHVLLWGVFAGFENRFLLGDLESETRDDWARLIVTIYVGSHNYNNLSGACVDTLNLARGLWHYTLSFRQFSVSGGYGLFSDTFTVSESDMVWFDDTETPFVVDVSFAQNDKTVSLGSLSKRPPSGNWYTKKDLSHN